MIPISWENQRLELNKKMRKIYRKADFSIKNLRKIKNSQRTTH